MKMWLESSDIRRFNERVKTTRMLMKNLNRVLNAVKGHCRLSVIVTRCGTMKGAEAQRRTLTKVILVVVVYFMK